MRRSRTYRATGVKKVEWKEVVRGRGGQAMQVGVDIGKRSILAVVRWRGDPGQATTGRPGANQRGHPGAGTGGGRGDGVRVVGIRGRSARVFLRGGVPQSDGPEPDGVQQRGLSGATANQQARGVVGAALASKEQRAIRSRKQVRVTRGQLSQAWFQEASSDNGGVRKARRSLATGRRAKLSLCQKEPGILSELPID
jgi:hypothetical protein